MAKSDSSTAQYLAKIKKTLDPFGLTVKQFQQNPWVLAKVSKNYEKYLINKYQQGNSFKWWGRPTTLYHEAHNYAEEYDEEVYITNIMKSNSTLSEHYKTYQSHTAAVDEELMDIPMEEGYDITKGNNVFSFLYRHPE